MSTIGLVACCKRKRLYRAAARDLYCSPLFQAAAAYAQARYSRWFILSAWHGLVHPDQPLSPYDLTLADQPAAWRRDWGRLVLRQLQFYELPAATRYYAHAGEFYVRPLLPLLPLRRPLRGLGIGQQLAWYRRRHAQKS